MPEPRDDRSITDYYDLRYATRRQAAFGRPPEESVERLRIAALSAGDRVLDVGCGQGFFLHASHDAGCQPVGVDISAQAASIAREVSLQAPVVVAGGEWLPFADATFDVVTCWGALEHHPDMARALSEFRRVLRPGGRAILRVPNRDFWVYRLYRLLGLRAGTEQIDIVEHQLDCDEWIALFREHGLYVQRISADNWFLRQRFRAADGLRANLKLALRKFALRATPLRWTYSYDFVCAAAD
jgi:ubiquinone/menaquinone biosynthesis C-methylase UbiE